MKNHIFTKFTFLLLICLQIFAVTILAENNTTKLSDEKILEILEQTIFPELKLIDSSFIEAIQHIEKLSAQYASNKKGIKINCSSNIFVLCKEKINIHLSNCSLIFALNFLCELNDLSYRIQDGELFIFPEPEKVGGNNVLSNRNQDSEFFIFPEAKKIRGNNASLKKNGILISDEVCKQIFSPYLEGTETPLFITSDSLINAYHVLYEESILQLENAMASKLPEILTFILSKLKNIEKEVTGNTNLVFAAKTRANIVVGIAMKLIDNSFNFEDTELDKILVDEIKKITEAKIIEKPKWLGEPEKEFLALDYSKFKPRGFYTKSEKLKKYFRAISWLQSIPFYVKNDKDFMAILMLGSTITYERFSTDYEKRQDFHNFFKTYKSFIGEKDDWDLITAAYESQIDLSYYFLKRKRKLLIEKAQKHSENSKINDQIMFPPEKSNSINKLNFRIISSYRTPSAILFQQTTDRRYIHRPFPEGLEICVALGSKFAEDKIVSKEKEKLLKIIENNKKVFKGNNLYFSYLNALKTLLDAPEPEAPAFMTNDAWKTKSCNTVLAGWAQLRHTWALQSKQTIEYFGLTRSPEGFVEPNPDFFGRMAELAYKTRMILKSSGVFELNYDSILQNFIKFQKIISGVKSEEQLRERFSKLSREEIMELGIPFMVMEIEHSKAERGTEKYFKENLKWFNTIIIDIKNQNITKHPKVKTILKEFGFDLEKLWYKLENVCRRLETIAHKQLRKKELNESEIKFIKKYGESIAEIMLYGGNSYLTPRDDSPRIVDVFSNSEKGEYLHVGISRPRKIYVLYPWKGKDILCVGAVLPYYEFVNNSRLTDSDWKKMLDSNSRPPILRWQEPIINGGKLTKPDLKDLRE